MTDRLPAGQLEAWRAVYRAFARIRGRIEANLVAAGRPALSWYDVLYTLYLAPDRHLRMSDLAARVLMSRSGLSRLVDRLEKENLIARQRCPQDGRALYAVLTEQGIGALREIWPVYRAGIAEYFAAPLSPEELAQLTAILSRLSVEPKDAAPLAAGA